MTPKAIAPGSLLDLAERVEALAGPDRDIDTEILWHINRGAFLRGYWNAASGMPRPLEQMPSKHGGLGWIGAQCCAPTYTGSIDSAMTLVPELCLAMVKQLWDGDTKAGYAVVHSYYRDAEECDGKRNLDDFTAIGETPALALTAASLRARAHQSGEQA
jgi:hypothetical protein